MSFCKHTQMAFFEIWSPKYSTKTVQLKATKVADHNKIVFTKAPSMGAEPYYISGGTIKKYKKTTNGSIPVYEVPLKELQLLEYQDKCLHLI